MNDKIKNNVVNSLIVKFLEKFLISIIQLVISIIIARLLNPSDFGTIVILGVFISIPSVIIDSGLAVGLIQKRELTIDDTNTSFTIAFFFSFFLYIVYFNIAPLISNFYKIDDLVMLIRVYSLSIFFSSLNSIFNSLLSRNFRYKVQLITSLFSLIFSGISTILMALHGFGIWSLVFQNILFNLSYFLILLSIFAGSVRFYFSKESFLYLFNFSWKILLARLLNSLFVELKNLVIAKQYSNLQLGLYTKGSQIPATIATSTDYSIQNVMFAVYSRSQDDLLRLRTLVRRSVKITTYILFPMMIGLATVAKPIVQILLTDKWLESVPFLQITSLIFMLQPLISANYQAVNSIGRSDINLKIEVINKISAIILLLFFSLTFNILVFMWATFFVSLLNWFQYLFISRNLLKYSIREQIGDILPAFSLSTLMGVIVYLITMLKMNVNLTFITQVITGISIYILFSLMFKIESFMYLISLVKERLDNANNI